MIVINKFICFSSTHIKLVCTHSEGFPSRTTFSSRGLLPSVYFAFSSSLVVLLSFAFSSSFVVLFSFAVFLSSVFISSSVLFQSLRPSGNAVSSSMEPVIRNTKHPYTEPLSSVWCSGNNMLQVYLYWCTIFYSVIKKKIAEKRVSLCYIPVHCISNTWKKISMEPFYNFIEDSFFSLTKKIKTV